MEAMERLRFHLAYPDEIVLLSLLAVLTGLLAGSVIVVFRLSIEWLQTSFLFMHDSEAYEYLSLIQRFLFPILGALILALCFYWLKKHQRQVGPVHVIERFEYHQGRMPFVNVVVQFFGAVIALASGHSVGREGPSIHIGAYSGSALAQWLQLPNNSTRTLLACGSAAAISASFNTPLAAIIFAMEVIVQQYTVVSFIPVILATVSGTIISLYFIGEEIFFIVPQFDDFTSIELPIILLMGVLIGGLSVAFNYALVSLTRLTQQWSILLRFSLAGVIMGIVAVIVPEVMGGGYDTIMYAFNGQGFDGESLTLTILLMILAAKFLASFVCLGFGIPGGIIGPLMFMGAITGTALGLLFNDFFYTVELNIGSYGMLGMGAMFAAGLQAPLAALTAVLELTDHPQIILPAMLVIITATLTSKVVFKRDSLFRHLLQARGLDHSASPVMQRLRNIGVTSAIDRDFSICNPLISPMLAEQLLERQTRWLLITDSKRLKCMLLRSIDLRSFLKAHPHNKQIDLYEIPARRWHLQSLSVRASLQEALDQLDEHHTDALYVKSESTLQIYGIITRGRIERAYL